MKRSLIKISIYLLPAILAGVFILLKIFPNEVFILSQDKELESNLILIGENDLIAAPLYDFNKIKINISPDSASADEIDREITVKKDYIINFYPEKKQESLIPPYTLKKYNNKYYLVYENKKELIPTDKILESYGGNQKALPMNQAEFKKIPLSKDPATFIDGTLVGYKDSVFVISRGKMKVIASAQVFDRFGFNWDHVIEITPAEARIHKNDPEPLLLTSPHPFGTIIDNLDGTYYLIQEKERLKINDQDYQKYFGSVHPVSLNYSGTLDNLNINQNRTCFLNNNLSCSLNIDKVFKNQAGYGYFFDLPKKLPLQQAKIIFTRKISLNNLKKTAAKFR
ncbi:MAG: hypothetical protein GF347_05680 [Candidatus Moranbacteria bacterium]|nr:hypothetical protein [Candidatus Moranbacteria bacterium]